MNSQKSITLYNFMSEDYGREVMRAIGRLEGKVEDILIHQKSYNGQMTRLGDKIIEHEKQTNENLDKLDLKNSVTHKDLEKRIGKNEKVVAKFLGVVSFVGFLVSLTFNAIWEWVTKGGS